MYQSEGSYLTLLQTLMLSQEWLRIKERDAFQKKTRYRQRIGLGLSFQRYYTQLSSMTAL